MLVSVVVPIYHVEKYLDQCIESICKQSYQELEIILVDDGSGDSCPQICDRWAERDPRIKVIHKMNGGLVSARIAGSDSANGEYIAYVDGDDYIETDFIRHLAEEAQQSGADMVLAGYRTVSDGKVGTPKINRLPVGYYDSQAMQETIRPHIIDKYSSGGKYGIMAYVWCKLYRSTLLKTYQRQVPLEIRMGEDQLLVLMCLNASQSISVKDFSDYRYRQVRNSMSAQYDESYLQRQKKLYQSLWETLNRTDCPRKKEQYTAYILNAFFIGACNIVRLSNLKQGFTRQYQSFKRFAVLSEIHDACASAAAYGFAHPNRWITRMWRNAGNNRIPRAFLCVELYQTGVLIKKLLHIGS